MSNSYMLVLEYSITGSSHVSMSLTALHTQDDDMLACCDSERHWVPTFRLRTHAPHVSMDTDIF